MTELGGSGDQRSRSDDRRHHLGVNSDHEPSPITAPTRAQDGPRFTMRERIALTYEYHGGWSLVLRVLTFPLRFTPLEHRGPSSRAPAKARIARPGAGTASNGRPVTIVIPSYKDADDVANAGGEPAPHDDSRARPDRRRRRRAAAPSTSPRCARSRDRGDRRRDQRGLCRQRQPRHPRRRSAIDDVVVLNSDVIAERDWLESLQYAASTRMDDVGIVGAKLLYPDGRIQFGGTVRNLGAPEWFDHRYRFKRG